MSLIESILLSVIFFLPAYIANAMPVIASGLNLTPHIAKPINKKLFGKSKTYRGFVYGISGALIIGLLKSYLVGEHLLLSLQISFLLGFGALLGDLVKSFFKRKIGIKSGESWPVFDQIDYVVGALILVSFIFPLPLKHIIILVIISPILSLVANTIAYLLKLKKVWW